MKQLSDKTNSRFIKAVILPVFIILLSAVIKIDESANAPRVAQNPTSLSGEAIPYVADPKAIADISASEKSGILSEFPVYGSRSIEQTYLTMPEWYQVYSYNEFADFLQNGGRQTEFPFLRAIKNFWGYYRVALNESRNREFNWQYNFVTWVIGANLTAEYFAKFFYENTIGSFTQFLSRGTTDADKFIAESWNNYAERMYQTTWYHYPYFDDLMGIWTETRFFDRDFIRNLERKIAFSFSYFIKGSYAKLWLLTAVQKENQTLSLIEAPNRSVLEDPKIKVFKELPDGRYLIETERYAGFKDALLKLLSKDVRFLEIQGHDIITLSYLSHEQAEPFLNAEGIDILDKRELFFDTDGYTHRVTLRTRVTHLAAVIRTIELNGGKFEMIYDF